MASLLAILRNGGRRCGKYRANIPDEEYYNYITLAKAILSLYLHLPRIFQKNLKLTF